MPGQALTRNERILNAIEEGSGGEGLKFAKATGSDPRPSLEESESTNRSIERSVKLVPLMAENQTRTWLVGFSTNVPESKYGQARSAV